MRKKLTTLSVAAGLMTTSVIALAPAAAATSDDTGRSVPVAADHEVTCSAGGATGTARVTVERVGGSSTGYQHRATVRQYKIEHPGETGRNANVDLGLVGDWGSGPGGTLTWWKSRDEMIQDGQWHDNLTLAGPLVGSIPGPTGRTITTSVKFVFDKADASDPDCTASFRTVH